MNAFRDSILQLITQTATNLPPRCAPRHGPRY